MSASALKYHPREWVDISGPACSTTRSKKSPPKVERSYSLAAFLLLEDPRSEKLLPILSDLQHSLSRVLGPSSADGGLDVLCLFGRRQHCGHSEIVDPQFTGPS